MERGSELLVIVLAIVCSLTPAALCGWWASNVAGKKGHSRSIWFWVGFFAGFIGPIIAYCLSEVPGRVRGGRGAVRGSGRGRRPRPRAVEPVEEAPIPVAPVLRPAAVAVPVLQPVAAPQPAAPPAAQGADWHYDAKGRPAGPVPLGALRGLWKRGVVDGRTLVWKKGMGDWRPIDSIPALRTALEG